MNTNKLQCILCGKEITTNNITRHIAACKGPKIKKINLRNTGMKGRNQFSKARDEGREIPVQSAETKAKALATKKANGTLKHSQKTKDKLAISMKRAVQLNPEAYSSANRGRTKQITIDGIKLQGKWEVDFYLWAKRNNLAIARPSSGFKYIWNGDRTYFPDFYVEDVGFVEVKGYATDRDYAKWNQFKDVLYIVKKQEIEEIRNDSFTVDKLKTLMYNQLS